MVIRTRSWNPNQSSKPEPARPCHRLNWLQILTAPGLIFLGEIHDHPLQHQRQLEIIQALWARDRNMVIGLELFEHPSQFMLDQWTKGLIFKDDFKKELQADLSPDILAVYYPLLAWAGKRGVPLLALNLPRKISALVARNGLTGLSDEQVRALPREIEVGPDEYRQRVARAFKHHGMFMDLEKFFTAQVVRDEAMAQTLTDYLSAPENENVRAVVIAGNEHVAGGYGLPDRVARRLPEARASLLMPDAHDDYPAYSADGGLYLAVAAVTQKAFPPGDNASDR